MLGLPNTTSVHSLFLPMKSTAVLDRYAVIDQICRPRLVLLCNTELTEYCKASIDRLTESGTFCIATQFAAEQFPHKGNRKNWAVCSHFCEEYAKDAAAPYLNEETVFEMRYRSHTLRVFPTDDTGNRLDFAITKRK